MKKFTLKQWILAGIKSGIIVSFLSFASMLFLWLFFDYGGFCKNDFTNFLYSLPISNIFIGTIIGIILFLTYDRISLIKNTSLKYLTILAVLFLTIVAMLLWWSLTIMLLPFPVDIIFTYLTFEQAIALHVVIPVFLLPEFLIALAYRFLIIHFVEKNKQFTEIH